MAFFAYALQVGAAIEVNLWQLTNPATDSLLGATRRTGGLAAFYVALSNASILFSVFPVGPHVIAYFCFSALTLVASVVVPPIPLMRKLRAAKNHALLEIDKQLHLEFYRSLDSTSPSTSALAARRVNEKLETSVPHSRVSRCLNQCSALRGHFE